MPVTTVQTPQGDTVDVQHPEGATPEQIIDYAKANYKPTAPRKSVGREMLEATKLTEPGWLESAALRASGGLPIPMRPYEKAIDWTLKGAMAVPNFMGQTARMAHQQIGSPKPVQEIAGIGAELATPSVPGLSLARRLNALRNVIPKGAVAAGVGEALAPTKTVLETAARPATGAARIAGLARPAAEAEKYGPVTQITRSFREMFAPRTLGYEASRTAQEIQQMAGEAAQREEIARHALGRAQAAFDRMPKQYQADFMEKMGKRLPQATPALDTVATTIRQLLDSKWQEVRKFGTKPANEFAKGLRKFSDNPVEESLFRLAEMEKYIFGKDILRRLQQAGLATKLGKRTPMPKGWVIAPPQLARGWAVPRDAGLILHNYLSPGIRGTVFRAPYEGARWLGNNLNMAQLGMSAFHWTLTALESMISKASVGFREIFTHNAPLRGMAKLMTFPAAPVQDIYRGSQLVKAYLNPSATSAKMAPILEAFVKSGSRISMDRFYYNSAAANFWKSLRTGRYGRAGLQSVPAAIEAVGKPLMQWWVPRLKAGVFSRMMEAELRAMKPGEDVVKIAQRVQASVDNRMGQLVYDNLFWNKALKDLGLLSVRALGWNLGTIREVGGGLKEFASVPKRIIKGEERLTHKASYIMGMVYVTGLIGGTAHYLMTGTMPEDAKDWFFPGEPGSKVSLPSYMRDVMAYREQPWQTVKHKLNPEFELLAEMLENQDFYGAAIYNPQDPMMQQAVDVFEHTAKAFVPFTFRQYTDVPRPGVEPINPILPFFGVTRSPRYIQMTPDEKAEYSQWIMRNRLKKKYKQESQ